MMQFKRPIRRTKEFKDFEIGTHQATIQNVNLKETKKGKPMFSMLIKGKNGESGFFHLVFDTDFTEENLNFLLASIEDNGYDIPGLNFEYSEETATFLKGKTVYIKVEVQYYQDKPRNAITMFLTLDEFEEDDSDFPSEEEVGSESY